MNPCTTILSQLLLSNRPPGSLETGPLQAEVDRLKGKIFALRSKLQEYEELLQNHQTALSIARRVPLDVWGIIFSFVLPNCSTREDWQQSTNLSLVCKDWYQVARFIHRPSSHLKLKDIELAYENVMSWSRRAAEGRSLQIEGTGWGCPLHRDPGDEETDTESESYNRDNEASDSQCRFVTPALLRLMTEGPILDHLLFEDVRSRCYRHLLSLLASYDASNSPRLWDNLQKFTLHFDSEGNYPPIVVLGPEPIDVPPCVTSLNLQLPDSSSVEIGADSSPLFLSPGAFKHLTSFSLKWGWDEHDGKVLLAALSHCANLDTLALNFKSRAWSCMESSKAVKLPKLRNLELAEPEKDSIKFLNFIDTPALIRLDVHIGEKVKPDILSSFITKQFTRSQGTLHVSLRVSHLDSEWNTPEFLRHIPHVTHLILDHCVPPPKDLHCIKNGPDFFWSLGFYKDTLPHLKVLEIFGLPAEIPIQWLENYINSRRREYADDGLKTVVVKFDYTGLPESCTVRSLEPIERLRNAGLSVCVEHPKFYRKSLLDIYK